MRIELCIHCAFAKSKNLVYTALMTYRCLSFVGLLFVNANFSFAAETFTISLDLQVEANASGEYLSASYDFGTRFSEVESVQLEFVMPEGYEGSAVSTGNSTYTRNLAISIDDGRTALDSVVYDLSFALRASPFAIPAGETNTIHLRPHWSIFGEPGVVPDYPSFLLDGKGRANFVEVRTASFHPLPEGNATSFSTSWNLPGPIDQARLTIVATPVPEPSCVSLLAIAICLAWIRIRMVR